MKANIILDTTGPDNPLAVLKLTPENDDEREALSTLTGADCAHSYLLTEHTGGPSGEWPWTYLLVKPGPLNRVIFDDFPEVELYTPEAITARGMSVAAIWQKADDS